MTPSPRRPPSSMSSDQRKPVQFPLIPPLPPSNSYEKENQRQPEALSRSTDVSINKTSRGSLTLTLTPQSRNYSTRQPLSAHRASSLGSSPPLPRRNSQGSKRRVLRYGETIESLFCLTEHTTPDHRRLCHDIVEGPLADDAASWLCVLEAASEQVAKNTENAEQGKPVRFEWVAHCFCFRRSYYLTLRYSTLYAPSGADLIRLHRRATSRFSALSEGDLHKDGDKILALWLAYARVQASYGSAQDARLTFRHMKNQHIGASNASFYLKFAEFERQHDASRAIQVLRAGIEQKAAPLQALHDAMNEIQESDGRNDAPSSEQDMPVGGLKPSAQIPELPSASTLQSKKRKTGSDISPKRLKKNDGTAEIIMPSTDADCSEGMEDNVIEMIQTRTAASSVQRSSEKVSFADGMALESSRTTGRELAVKTPIRSQLVKGTARPAFGSVSILKAAQKNPSLIAKTPRLSRVGLSGKPMRVTSAEEKPVSDSDSSMDTATQSETIEAKLLDNITDSMDSTSTKPAPKISRMDLSYMLNWDPNSRRTPQAALKCERVDKQTDADSQHQALSKVKTPSMETIEEIPSNSSAASFVTSTIHSNSTKSAHNGHESQHSDRSDGSAPQPSAPKCHDSQQPATVEPTATLDQTSVLVAKSNADFLPLVSEDNIVRVNNKPYVKLGVIGKGGSCKVYRALSKDCSILAIKKVKLGGMDQKAINGYANEIALLKRLRGNASIIQMYDSEVDLSRKAIFVVMELGEVDLNQVMQQQTLGNAKESKSGNRSALDMNFIRLTWQQMLKAVHSIHEERIIHGDLKPANFLFVRGALKLIDFGIAKAIHSDDTTSIYRESQIGTLNYMSPEAILDTGSGANGARMKIGRVSVQ